MSWKSGHFLLCSYFQLLQFFLHPVATKRKKSYIPKDAINMTGVCVFWITTYKISLCTSVKASSTGVLRMRYIVEDIGMTCSWQRYETVLWGRMGTYTGPAKNIISPQSLEIQPWSRKEIATIDRSGKKVKTNWKLLLWSQICVLSYKSTNWWSLPTSFLLVLGKHRFLDNWLPRLSRCDELWIRASEQSSYRTHEREESSSVWLQTAMKPSGNYNFILDFSIQPEIWKMLCFCRWWKHITLASWQNCKVAFMFHY